MSIAIIGLLVLLACAFAVDSHAEPRIWAVGESVRVDPVTARVIEQRPGESTHVVTVPVRLQGARNETVAFQVIVEDQDGEIRDLDIDFPELRGPATLARGPNISIFREWYVHLRTPSAHDRAREITHAYEAWFPVARYERRLVASLGPGWYPDPLVPLDGPLASRLSAHATSLPSRDNPVPGQRAQGFWIDVWIPPGTPPGRYAGEVVVTADGTHPRLAVRLEVLPVDLPDESLGHAGLGSISYEFVGRHLAGIGPGAVQDLYRLMHRHRLSLDALFLHPEWRDGEIDWSEYDELVGPLLDGSAFSERAGYDGPGRDRPVARFVLPLDWSWPVSYGAAGHDEAFVDSLRQVEAHILERGWTRTQWSVFINLTDEPHRPEDFAMIREYGDLIRSARLSRPELFRYRIDAGAFKSIGQEIPGWDVHRIFAEVGDEVDIWDCCASVEHFPMDELAGRLARHPDEEAWFYFSNAAGEPAVGSLLIDGEALGPRTWGWIVWRYGLSAGVSWEVGVPSARCLREPDCSGFGLHGDASIVYLADSLGAPGAVLPSIRLKGLRRGAEDHQVLLLVARERGRDLADAYAYRLVPRALDDRLVRNMPGAWEHDADEWDEAREQMGLILAGRLEPPPVDELRDAAPPVEIPPLGLTRRAALIPAALLVLLLIVLAVATERGRRRLRARADGSTSR